MAENNLGLKAIAGSVLYAGRLTTYENYRCTLMQSDAALEVVINGIDTHTVAGIQTSINIRPLELTADPTIGVTFWCSCFDGCNPTAFTGTTAPSSANGDWSKNPSGGPTIIGGGGLNN